MSFDCPYGHHATHNRPLSTRNRLKPEETRAVRHALLAAVVGVTALAAAGTVTGTVATAYAPAGPSLVATLER